MAEFISTFVFILPGIMAYFWLQLFGLNPSVKHTAPELSGISALLWLPVSFSTLMLLNLYSTVNISNNLTVDTVWTIEDLNSATSDIKYLMLFLTVSFFVSFFVCWVWGLWGYNLVRIAINKVRKTRKIAALSSSQSVWEEFFIKIEDPDKNEKEAVYMIYKIDKPEEKIIGTMTKVSRPLEIDRSLVLEETEEWKESVEKHYDFDVKRVYIDTKTGMVVKELNPKEYTTKTIPVSDDKKIIF
jgi:hypothetical protein